jgi:hypothetical protein
MARRFPWKKWQQRISLWAGLFLAVFSMFAGLWEILVGPSIFEPKIHGLLLFVLGTLITVSVLDRRSEREEHQDRIREYEKIHESLESLKPFISVALGAVGAGVESIFARRKGDERAEKAIEAHILDEDTKTISIAAIALPSFLHAQELYGEAIRRRFEADDVHWRILLLNPRRRAARDRAVREKGTVTIADIERSIEQIQEYMDKGKNVEARLYDCPPIVFLLITERSMLVEPYHFGRIVRPDENKPEADRVVTGCIGGRVPLLQLRNLGQYDKAYAIFCDHFEYMWRERSIPVYSGVRIVGCDPEKRTITLKNTHGFTAVSLENWWLEGAYKTSANDGDSGDIATQKIYRFTAEDWLEPQTELEIRDAMGRNTGRVRYLNPNSGVSTFMKGFWEDEDHELRLFNIRGRMVAKFPTDGYVGQDEFPPYFPPGDTY